VANGNNNVTTAKGQMNPAAEQPDWNGFLEDSDRAEEFRRGWLSTVLFLFRSFMPRIHHAASAKLGGSLNFFGGAPYHLENTCQGKLV
jgi:hypothetical protein